MIAFGYSLLVTCENRYREWNEHSGPNWSAQYTGETKARVFNDARSDGWIIDEQKRTAICPRCSQQTNGKGRA